MTRPTFNLRHVFSLILVVGGIAAVFVGAARARDAVYRSVLEQGRIPVVAQVIATATMALGIVLGIGTVVVVTRTSRQ